ncbi:nucleotide-diphospho-sugar transferase [Radiomyces spectabilis]|uniref:nucleotide-diphospho-sugar transferase n=1 Tax=Radiomyces spectabilis TaxID=64574 RepID=UPI00221E941B|nr:nucleotide-diphospho-sugar transferase [Radiomyces spectabilis]KAI8369604.1 nucleotide-diphospho-sugar transferase [Radiomyces spectabilis]
MHHVKQQCKKALQQQGDQLLLVGSSTTVYGAAVRTSKDAFNPVFWTLPIKILYSVAVSGIFVIPAIIGYALHLRVASQQIWALGAYGTVVFSFIALQLLFATLNRISIFYRSKKAQRIVARPPIQENMPEPKPLDADTRYATKIGLAVVGYREEPTLFAHCLESIQGLEYPENIKVVVVIDGDAPQDSEMASIFQKVFPDAPIVVLPYLLSDLLESNKHKTTNDLEGQPSLAGVSDEKADSFFADTNTVLPIDTPVCYLQPHRGKRHAMYTAFRILMAAGCEAVMSTDSDTKFEPNALLELEKAIHYFPKIGAAAGDVRIWNATESLLSFMSSLRYWMAFNIERAAQSFNRCVTCVSGPMGLYRSSVLREVLDEWITQRFLGLECTYGDDRHLTNRVLMRGYRVVFTHLARCETETPTGFLRWFKQQTRWSKSFYRELIWNARSLHKHSPWMAAELFYQGIYPFVLLFSIFYIMYAHAPLVLCVWLLSLMIIASIKAVYALVVSRSARFLAFPIYSLYYLLGLVPAKVWALISLWDVGWGTSARSAAERKSENVLVSQIKEGLPVIIWFIVVLAGVAFNLIVYFIYPERFGYPSPFSTSDPTSIVFFNNPEHNSTQ